MNRKETIKRLKCQYFNEILKVYLGEVKYTQEQDLEFDKDCLESNSEQRDRYIKNIISLYEYNRDEYLCNIKEYYSNIYDKKYRDITTQDLDKLSKRNK